MFFSIIIPMYNAREYISQCIESLLCQTMKDFEVVVVDDGSKDNSGEIIRSYMEKDSRVRLISQENSGQSKARNTGLRESQGEYIIYLDSDDFVMKEDFLHKVKSSIDTASAEVVMYRYVKYYDGANPRFEKSHYDFQGTKGIASPEKLLPLLAQKDAYYGSAWTKSIKRELLIKHSIFFDEELSCEDFDWSYRIIEKVSSIACLDEAFIAYRQRQNSVTTSGSYKNAEDCLLMVEKYKSRYEDVRLPLSAEMRQGLLATVAKLYCNLLLTYIRVNNKDKKFMKPRLKALAPVLNYGTSKRPLTLRRIYKIFGFSLMLKALSILDSLYVKVKL